LNPLAAHDSERRAGALDTELQFNGSILFFDGVGMSIRTVNPLPLVGVAVWTCGLLLAVCCKDVSTSAGRLPQSWTGAAMIFALPQAAMVTFMNTATKSNEQNARIAWQPKELMRS
jgi:hypothetical protein